MHQKNERSPCLTHRTSDRGINALYIATPTEVAADTVGNVVFDIIEFGEPEGDPLGCGIWALGVWSMPRQIDMDRRGQKRGFSIIGLLIPSSP